MPDTRTQIVEAADTLFYQRGFDHTSLADIAAAVGIARGNLTYHFKAKDQILAAVIDRRLANTQAMLDAWEEAADGPAARITSFIHILIINQAKIMAHGCPVGTLSNELAKLDHAALPDAARIFTLFRSWLARQFTLLGHNDARADELALHLLGRSQGVATLATAFKDEDFIRREVAAMRDWLSTLADQP
ncbi:TetR/AcrR family transcriptional regulator [Niveispirillum cyanobacteriorum]|uniref:TetR family transcriptional regulator n=1 Tax=Niveispirillum cyanobacteriorum TaxID=1612173 RepID=A0A2K9N7B3_9PROT|nr:TetR/AcrR family transcriptional regulator [Niveispirillum cyanobacteriorum]AUN28974.1 TetR family transcriptional regulator [Niveispirillum cyanobacteriorum]GGE68630.1 TetR family transcriptional regulator [Niveispirillum cyanobacteriorum]